MSTCCESAASAVAVDDVSCIVDCRLPGGQDQDGSPTKCVLVRSEGPMADGRLRAKKCDDARSCLLDPTTGVCHVIDDDKCTPEPGVDSDDEELGGG